MVMALPVVNKGAKPENESRALATWTLRQLEGTWYSCDDLAKLGCEKSGWFHSFRPVALLFGRYVNFYRMDVAQPGARARSPAEEWAGIALQSGILCRHPTGL